MYSVVNSVDLWLDELSIRYMLSLLRMIHVTNHSVEAGSCAAAHRDANPHWIIMKLESRTEEFFCLRLSLKKEV